ncbi:hypothetical protein OPQ81_010795 [Rhizoctonia solani]|nr:hypothetical protein OPQ81_010795 [Rhizoctonia solani]
MPTQRRPSATHDLARRFLQLDADIRLAAAADGLFPFQKERPESPVKNYPYDALLQHPKPKPANGPIKIRQLEHVAKAKPSLKTRSVSDPGDAHRLISRFVQEKSRTMTSQSSPPASPSVRAFPFPSMAIRHAPQLENFIEMESTADEMQDDPLALKMGQILARRAAAATRALGGSSRRSSRRSSVVSGRRSVDSHGRRSVDIGQKTRLRIESILDAVGKPSYSHSHSHSHDRPAKRDSALLVPPPVVVDDRSPQEGPSGFWPRAPKSKGLIVGGVGSANQHQPPGADDSLNTFTFPSLPPSSHFGSQPPAHFGQPSSHFGSQPPPHFGTPSYQLQIQTRVPLTVQTNLDPPASPVMFHEDAQSVSFVMQASPTSGVYTSPVESLASPRSLRFSTSIEGANISFEGTSFEAIDPRTSFEVEPRTSLEGTRVSLDVYDNATTSFNAVTTSPTHARMQTSPITTRVQSSPTTMRVQASPTTMRVQASRAAAQSSPTTLRVQAAPVTMTVQTSPTTMRVQTSPTVARFQQSPSTARFQQSPSAARFQNSPTAARLQGSPTASRFQHPHSASNSRIPVPRQAPSDTRYHSSPTTVYSQPSPATPIHSGIPVPVRSGGTPVQRSAPLRTNGTPIQRPPSDAHMHLLRGLSPLPSHGLPLPAPVRQTLKRGSLLGDAFVGSSLTEIGNVSSSTHGNASSSQDVTSSAQNVATSNRDEPSALTSDPTSPEELGLVDDPNVSSIREWSPPPPATPSPPPATSNRTASTPNVFSSPNAVSTPVGSRVLSSSNVFSGSSPTRPPPQATAAFPTTAASSSPVRALSPIPARLRRTTPDPGSASDEVVFRGSSSSASTPQKRKRRRTRLPVRAHSEGFIELGRESLVRTGSVRRTAQSLMRRGHTGDGGEVSSDGRDVVLFVPKSLGPPSRAPSPSKPLSRPPSPIKTPSRIPSPVKPAMPLRTASPVKLSSRAASPVKLPSGSASPSKLPIRVGSPVKPPVASTSQAIPPPLVRRASIPLPEASPTQQAPPPALGLVGAEPLMTSSQELPRRPSIELREPIIIQPRPTHRLDRVPWSPPRHVLSRMETASREGSFHTARDSPALATELDLEFPGSFPLVGTPVHMDEERESTTVHSAVTAEDNPLVQSAVRGTVSRPVTMTMTRRPSDELGSSLPDGTSPVRRPISAHSFHAGGLAPPASLAPSPSIPGPSHTPNSSNGGSSNHHMASIPVRRDQHYSPPGSLPESVTPPTEASRPPTERSNSHLEDETFYSVHASDSDIRLPVENWIAFTMNNMDANGLPITRETFDEFQSSEDEGAAVAEVLSRNSARRPDSPPSLDDILAHDDDNDSGESAGQSLSDVGTTPSPSRSGSRHSGWLAPSAVNTNLTLQTSGLEWSEDEGNISAFSINSDTSESNRLTVDQLQTVASIVHELNVRTPIPSASSSHLCSPPSLATTSAAYVTPPYPPPYRASHSAPSRTLSPGAVSITFSEASPSLSTIPPPSLVVHSENRNWFADNLLLGEYRRSLHYLRDDDQRALEEGEDVILYGGDWEHVGRRSESRATTSSAVPVESPADFDPATADPHSRNKYLQFLLSFAGALRHQGPPRSQRMVETALRTLRRQPSQPAPRYPADLYDEIGREEAGAVVPVPGTPRAPSNLPSSSSSSSSSDIGSALPDDDEIVEDFVRSIVTPQPGTPRRPPPAILIQGSNVVPWPALPSPVSPRIRFARPVSRQTARSQATSITTTQQSGYSSLIPPPPRPRPRSIEPHWLTIYVARRWPVPDTYVTRRTYSSPSALGPPMPYLWRPICHISPERLWEITNLEVQIPIPPPIPPAHSPQEPPNARQHFPTPATTQNHATNYSMYSVTTTSSRSSRSNMLLPPPPDIYPDLGFRTSHANLPIDSLSALPPLPPSVPTLMERQLSSSSIPPPPNHLASRLSLGSSSGSNRPSSRPRQPSTRIVTPIAMSRKRTLKEFVGKIVGGGGRTRTRSIHSRSSGPYVPKPKFGVAGKVVEVTRRIFRRGRRARLSSIRSQAQRVSPET